MMDLNEFKSRLKGGGLGGCYLFAGEEDYLKRYYMTKLREAVLSDEALAPFNHAVFDGEEIDFAALRDAIQAPPMMADFKLIEWKYASFDKMKESELALLEETLDLLKEYEYAVLSFLVADGEIDLGTPKRESKFAKRFGGKINLLRLDKSSDASLLSWLKKHFDAEGITADGQTLKALIFRSGHSMTVLNNEVIKLSAYAKERGKTKIDTGDVNLVASTTEESDTFALSNALLARNKSAAFDALREMKSRRLDPILILGMMAKTLSELATVSAMLSDGMNASGVAVATKMNPRRLEFFLNAARKTTPERSSLLLSELSRVDSSSKYGGVAGYTAIELFISKNL